MDALSVARLFVCAFFAVVLIQSSIDKLFDWKGNLEWLTGHFGKTFLRSQVPMMLGTVLMVELMGGFGCALSIIVLLTRGPALIPLVSMSLVCLNFVMLITGQRIAKDYAGAATIAAYFISALYGLTLMPSPV